MRKSLRLAKVFLGLAVLVSIGLQSRAAQRIDPNTGWRFTIDPMRIGYLRLVAGDPAAFDESNIRQTGEPIAALAQPFALIPQFRGLRLESGA